MTRLSDRAPPRPAPGRPRCRVGLQRHREADPVAPPGRLGGSGSSFLPRQREMGAGAIQELAQAEVLLDRRAGDRAVAAAEQAEAPDLDRVMPVAVAARRGAAPTTSAASAPPNRAAIPPAPRARRRCRARRRRGRGRRRRPRARPSTPRRRRGWRARRRRTWRSASSARTRPSAATRRLPERGSRPLEAGLELVEPVEGEAHRACRPRGRPASRGTPGTGSGRAPRSHRPGTGDLDAGEAHAGMVVQHAGDGPEVVIRGLGGQRQAEQTAAGLEPGEPRLRLHEERVLGCGRVAALDRGRSVAGGQEPADAPLHGRGTAEVGRDLALPPRPVLGVGERVVVGPWPLREDVERGGSDVAERAGR